MNRLITLGLVASILTPIILHAAQPAVQLKTPSLGKIKGGTTSQSVFTCPVDPVKIPIADHVVTPINGWTAGNYGKTVIMKFSNRNFTPNHKTMRCMYTIKGKNTVTFPYSRPVPTGKVCQYGNVNSFV